MKTRHLLTLLLACLTFASTYAKDQDDVKKQINRIKKSNAYLYAVATDSTEKGAYDLAEEMLYNEINAWAAKKKSMQGVKNFVVNNKKTLWTNLSLTRGNMVQSFVYVKKSDISPAENSEVISATTATPALSSTVEPIEEKKTQKTTKKSKVKYPDFIVELSQCTEYADFVTKLRQMKTDGRIKSYNRYSKLTNANACYLAIYNTAGKMVAILSPGDSRLNVATGAEDGVDNYHGCGAIGFATE